MNAAALSSVELPDSNEIPVPVGRQKLAFQTLTTFSAKFGSLDVNVTGKVKSKQVNSTLRPNSNIVEHGTRCSKLNFVPLEDHLSAWNTRERQAL
jgi:hypothetical protein